MHRFLTRKTLIGAGAIIGLTLGVMPLFRFPGNLSRVTYEQIEEAVPAEVSQKKEEPTLDTTDYDRRMQRLANIPAPASVGTTTSTNGTTSTSVASEKALWPVTDAPYPLPGALLPFNRIVAYYGNFYSKGMGVLGEYPKDEMLTKLKNEVRKWEAADPETPVIPAIHYIDVTAQGSAGKDGKYRLRMPDDQIDYALALAEEVNGIVFVDLQVGLSDIRTEIPLLEKYLSMPQVHLALDPEFDMPAGSPPGEVIGTMNAADVNWAAEYLAKLVRQYNLPPKILVIHRFTQDMLVHSDAIQPLPEVQIVIDMDGWGEPAKKKNTYAHVITAEPVQFTGFKLFYKNDLKPPSTHLMTPEEILDLTPAPIYIQYQ